MVCLLGVVLVRHVSVVFSLNKKYSGKKLFTYSITFGSVEVGVPEKNVAEMKCVCVQNTFDSEKNC